MYKYLSILLLALCAISCSHGSEEEEIIPEAAAEEVRKVPLEVRIAASEVQKRSPGDPVSDPRPPLPDYLYIFAVTWDEATGASDIYAQTFSNIESKWGQPNEEIYTYKETVILPGVKGTNNKAKLYIVASRNPIKFSPEHPQTKKEVEDLIIRKADNNYDNSVWRDIYFDTTDEFVFDWAQDYTGNLGENLTVTALCTHLCAKVDFLWNLSDVFRAANPDWKVKSVSVTGMPGACYAFKPTTPIPGEPNETETIFDTDQGSNIYGRTDFYHFQRPDDGSIGWHFEFMQDKKPDPTSYKVVEARYKPTQNATGKIAYYRLIFTVNGMNSATEINVSQE